LLKKLAKVRNLCLRQGLKRFEKSSDKEAVERKNTTLSAFKFLGLFTAFLTGCTVAVPEVTSLLSTFNSFKLTNNEYRISNLSELSGITLNASCDATNMGFEYEIPDVSVGVWNQVPTSSSGIFTLVNNQCSDLGYVNFTMDLSAVSPFSTMNLGETFQINFRDQNVLGLSQTQNFRITYSNYSLADSRFSNGQGLNSTKTSGSYTLQGRVMNIQQMVPVTSGSYTLQGKVIFQ
jgi:hypothetical protein